MSVIIVGGGMVGVMLVLVIFQFSYGMLLVYLIEVKVFEVDGYFGFDVRVIVLVVGICQ